MAKPGRSSGTRVHINTLADLVDPVIKHIEDVRLSHPHLKIFIYGHSMGGLVAVNAILQKPQMFSGFVAVGPLVRANPLPNNIGCWSRKFCTSLVP